MSVRAPSPRLRWLIPGLLALAAWTAYRGGLTVPFHFDDRPAIERNESIRQLWPLSGPLSPPVTAAGAAGRPLINLSLALNYAAGGLDPRGYHAVNLALHALSACVLWGLLRRLLAGTALAGRAEFVAAAVALAWVAHPLHSETVLGVVQRSELIVGLFYLLTLYGFVRGASSPHPVRWYAAATGACLLGVASKELIATAPVAVLLCDRALVAGTFREAWRRRRGLYLALAATWLPLAWLMLRHEQRAGTVGFGLGVSAWHYLLTQCDAIATYLRLAVWPHPLVVDYGVGVATTAGEVWAQGVLVVTLLAATVIALWRRPVAGLAPALFFLILAPSSSFVPLTTQPIAEHRMYLPLAAVLTLLVAAVPPAFHRPRVHWLAAGGLALALVTLAARRTQDFQSELRLWTDTVAKRPASARAHASLAGVHARAGRWTEALPHFAEAVRLRPDYADAQNDYAGALLQLGRPAEALERYRQAWQLKPGDADIRSNLGLALRQTGHAAEAVPHFEAALAVHPRRAATWNNLGDALLQAGRPAEALAKFETALRLAPDNAAAHHHAALALDALGRAPEALRHLAAAVQADPGNVDLRLSLSAARQRAGQGEAAALDYAEAARLKPDSAELRYNLGNLWLQLARTAEAIDAYRAALALRPDWAEAHHNLALALARAGRAAEAVPHYETTLRQLPDSAQVHHNLALALAALGRIAEAAAHDETALRLQPDFPAARRHLQQLRSR